jgi:hypothetical protein
MNPGAETVSSLERVRPDIVKSCVLEPAASSKFNRLGGFFGLFLSVEEFDTGNCFGDEFRGH